ncbi:MAG: HEAT repeat domain-containing protein [Planctomycetes bacterium]|nr:HEAT repeat domain-containing protein [Planctomycetota bacterium]
MKFTVIFLFLLSFSSLPAAEPIPTGPAAEKRFPPLKLPTGFKATLFACDPFIEYPSVIANGPRKGSIFVGVDYMTGLGTEIIRRSEVRLLEDTDGDGYADKSTVFAKEFNSIQGLAFHNGFVYVMHAPFLTRLRDTKGTGVADERKDMLEGLGLTPEKNPVRLHCANGVTVGHDGWLYLAMGDNGTNVKRPEGDRLILNGGGILRCRKDGSDSHVFATGTRNVYKVSLDEDLNVFFRDNENDGGDYKLRVCHTFFGADHGYPYHYYERPDEAMPPLGDFGLGSSAGGICYRETQVPAEYRGNLFNCEWGRSIVRSPLQRQGSGFAPVKETVFVASAEDDPYGFKPTDLVVDYDGAMFVSDWADGQRPKRGRGRIYRITYGKDEKVDEEPRGLIHLLKSDSYRERFDGQQRCLELFGGKEFRSIWEGIYKRGDMDVRIRQHYVWILANSPGSASIDNQFHFLKTDADVRVQIQAVRALADLTDPVLVTHRLDAAPGDAKFAARLAESAKGRDTPVLLEIIIALGRLRWADSPEWLQKNIAKPDATLAHAAMMTLRKSNNWPAVLKLLDLPETEPIRVIALRAIAEQYIPEIADGLIERLKTEKDANRRREYADALTRIYQKPAERVYWGYRPPPRPANTVAWDKTPAIETALNAFLDNSDSATRLAVAKRMQREKVPARLASLIKWLGEETNADTLMLILDLLREHPVTATREAFAIFVKEKTKSAAVRLEALKQFAAGLDEKSEPELLALASGLEHGPVLAEALRLLVKRPKLDSAKLLIDRVASYNAEVRAASIEGIGELKIADGAKRVTQRLEDRVLIVRRAAATAAGKLNLLETSPTLLKLARSPDPGVRRASFESLLMMKVKEILPLAVTSLNDPETQLAALKCVSEFGEPERAKTLIELARQNPSAEVLSVVFRTLTNWNPDQKNLELKQAVHELQGTSGILAYWRTGWHSGFDFIEQAAFGTGIESRIQVKTSTKKDISWVAASYIILPEKADVQFFLGTNAALSLHLNGKQIFKRGDAQPYRIDADRFDATLEKGINTIQIRFPARESDIDFHLRFRRKSATAVHEKLTAAALGRSGNVENGRKLFLNAERTQCIKCHRVADQGEKIGPELTGLGNRFSRIHIVESILEPSRTIGPAFQSYAVTLADGRTLIGIKIDETDKTITYADKEGKKHALARTDIEATRPEKLSVMPESLEKPLSVDEFVDLIAYLVSLKDTRMK